MDRTQVGGDGAAMLMLKKMQPLKCAVVEVAVIVCDVCVGSPTGTCCAPNRPRGRWRLLMIRRKLGCE